MARHNRQVPTGLAVLYAVGTALVVASLSEYVSLAVGVGGGLSTLICCYALQQLGSGRVVSLEHDAFFADVSQDDLSRHGLGPIARVHHAPIVQHSIRGRSLPWYDYSRADLPDEIDQVPLEKWLVVETKTRRG